MERVNRILNHKKYQEYLKRIQECEKERIFCHHDMVHFLDVARIAYLMDLTENLNIGKERIYTAALLHDIGRFVQYEDGTPHEIASALLAPQIMEECGYSREEITEVIEAIKNHRNKSIKEEKNLIGVLYRSDKMSRSCFGCAAEKECDWSREKKNMTIDL